MTTTTCPTGPQFATAGLFIERLTAGDFDRLAVALGGVWVCRHGAAAEDRDKVDLSGRLVTITVDLGAGDAAATIWTNDLTAAYVHENSAYST